MTVDDAVTQLLLCIEKRDGIEYCFRSLEKSFDALSETLDIRVSEGKADNKAVVIMKAKLKELSLQCIRLYNYPTTNR